MPEFEIRPEQPADGAAISDVVGRAFKRPEVVELVEAIRTSENYVPQLTLVATVEGAVVGFVMASHATLVDGDTRRRSLNLSPLAVAPEHERQGIGSALVHAVCAAADALGESLIILEGSPVFYGRLGFEHSAPLGVTLDLPDWAPSEAGQARRLAAYDPAIRGHVQYPPAFDVLTPH